MIDRMIEELQMEFEKQLQAKDDEIKEIYSLIWWCNQNDLIPVHLANGDWSLVDSDKRFKGSISECITYMKGL